VLGGGGKEEEGVVRGKKWDDKSEEGRVGGERGRGRLMGGGGDVVVGGGVGSGRRWVGGKRGGEGEGGQGVQRC